MARTAWAARPHMGAGSGHGRGHMSTGRMAEGSLVLALMLLGLAVIACLLALLSLGLV